MSIRADLGKTISYLKRNGFKDTFYAAEERVLQKRASKRQGYEYQDVTFDEALRERDLYRKTGPITFSIVVPVYHTPEPFLRDMIESVLRQTYRYFELILADASEDDETREIIMTYDDERVLYVKVDENKGISENTNVAIAHANGDYIGLLDHDDLLSLDALFWMTDAIMKGREQGKEIKLLYSNEDKCDGSGMDFFDCHTKREYNPDLLLANNYFCHFCVIESELMKSLLLRKEYDGAQDYDLVLRAVAALEGDRQKITRINRVLYHWRCHVNSTAQNPESKLYAYEAGRRAVQDYVDKKGWNAKVEMTKHLGFYHVKYEGNVFEYRKELGAVGGCIIDAKKRIRVGGMMDRDGAVVYAGLPIQFSGAFHRASLQQTALAIDIRCIRIAPECLELFEEIVGVPYKEDDKGWFDLTTLPTGVDNRMISLKLSKALRKKGYKLLWDPEMIRSI